MNKAWSLKLVGVYKFEKLVNDILSKTVKKIVQFIH